MVTTPRYIPPVTTPRYIPPVTNTPYPARTTPRYTPPTYLPPFDHKPETSNTDRVITRGDEDKPLQIVPQSCAAAMICTDIQYCDALGVISKTPVVLTKQQALFRVPVTSCGSPQAGVENVCCRDPDYTDPWPAATLGQYNREIINAAFDDGSYRGDTSFQQQRVQTGNQQRVPTGGLNQRVSFGGQQQQQQQQTVQTANRQQTINFQQQGSNDLVGSASGSCGLRNENTFPRGAAQFDTGFGEYTWQAMVLMQSNKSLLCGGAIIDENTVVTAAHCVQG